MRLQGRHPWSRVGGPPEVMAWVEDPDRPYWEPIVESDSYISAFVTVDGGSERPTYIGHRTFLMQHTHIGHDAIIGDDVQISGAKVGGFATVGSDCKIGMGAVILPRRTVGEGVVVGAGTIVTHDIPDGVVVMGNPARIKLDGKNPVPYWERL